MSKRYRVNPSYTVEQYEQLQEPDQYYISELRRGLLVREPRPGVTHSRVVGNIFSELRTYVANQELGAVFVECGFQLLEDPPTVRGPDIAFVGRERLPDADPRSFFSFAPDLAIEVLSPGNTMSYMQAKVLDFFEAGTRMVWVIDPATRTATVYRSLVDISLLRENDVLDGGDVVPGFSIRLANLLG